MVHNGSKGRQDLRLCPNSALVCAKVIVLCMQLSDVICLQEMALTLCLAKQRWRSLLKLPRKWKQTKCIS